MKTPNPPNWGDSNEQVRARCSLTLPSAEDKMMEQVLNMAVELNTYVLAGSYTKDQANEEWLSLWQELGSYFETSVWQESRRNEVRWKVDDIYREPIDISKIPNRHAYDQVMAWYSLLPEGHKLSEIEVKKQFSRGLICFGKTGMAKTRSVYARLIELYVYRDIEFIATMATQLKASIIDEVLKGPQQTNDFLGSLVATKILFIDDVCKIHLTPRFGQELYRIIEHRTNSFYHPIIITTQLTGDDLIKKWVGSNKELQDIAESIVRRLRDYCDSVDFDFNPDKSNITQTNHEQADKGSNSGEVLEKAPQAESKGTVAAISDIQNKLV